MKPAQPSHRRADANGATVLGAESGDAGERDPGIEEPHQVHGVEDLHLADGGTAWVRQVAVVVVYGQRTQACGNTPSQTQSGPEGSLLSCYPRVSTGLTEVCVSRHGRGSCYAGLFQVPCPQTTSSQGRRAMKTDWRPRWDLVSSLRTGGDDFCGRQTSTRRQAACLV